MATFIELVNRVERESGTIAQTQRLTTVSGAVGRQEKVVEWTSQAWVLIQRMRQDWTFLRKEFSHALTIDETRYTAADLGVTDFNGWLAEADGHSPWSIYDNAIGQSDETVLRVCPYRAWRQAYDFGAHDALRPNVIAFASNAEREVCVGPKPDSAYIVRGAYRRAYQKLAANADEPYIADDYHDAIVWQALALLAEHDEAPVTAFNASMRFAGVYSAMVREYTEPVET